MIDLIPPSLSPLSFYSLIVLSCFTSFLTTSVGIGGGMIMLAVMAQVLPVKAIIPIHGVVQLGSNFSRAMVLLNYVRWDLLLWFSVGSGVGALIGGQLVVSLPVELLRLTLGGFILFSVWGTFLLPNAKTMLTSPMSLNLAGLFSTILTMFVGATGPFVLAMLNLFKLDKQTFVASAAILLVVQHGLKVLVFGLLGFAFADYFWLIILMIVSGFVGTLLGRTVLLAINPAQFTKVMNIILTLLALRLIYSGIAV